MDRLDPEQGSLLMTRRTEEPGFARERDGHVLQALGAFVTGNALARVAAGQKAFNGMSDDGAKEAIVFEESVFPIHNIIAD